MLRPFEEIWGKSLIRQQQSILEAQRNAQQGAGAGVPGVQPVPAQVVVPPPPVVPQQPVQAPPPAQQQQQQPQRPPSQNGVGPRPGLQQAPSASQLEASRQQLLLQAKAASLAAQQVGAGVPALAAKQQQAQAQQQAQGAAGKVNTEPTLEQIAEAKNSVQLIRQSIDQTRRASLLFSLSSLARARG